MAGPNTEPVFSKKAYNQRINNITAANTNIDLTSGTSYLLFDMDGAVAPNGGVVEKVIISANPSQNTAATVFRVWLNDGSAITADNTSLIANAGMPATTASNTAALPICVIPLDIRLMPDERLYLSLGTAPGGSGEFMATTLGSQY